MTLAHFHRDFHAIPTASEVMAVMALASSSADMRRLDSIVVGVTRQGRPVLAADPGVITKTGWPISASGTHANEKPGGKRWTSIQNKTNKCR